MRSWPERNGFSGAATLRLGSITKSTWFTERWHGAVTDVYNAIVNDDTLENQVTTLYLDIDVTLGNDWNRPQLF